MKLKANRVLVSYLAAVSLVIPLACPAAVDDQSNEGSRRVFVKGHGETRLGPTSVNFGTYRTKAVTSDQKKNCRWRLLVPIPGKPGKYFQTSPKQAGQWHRVKGITKTGSVKITKVTDPKYKNQPRILDSEHCARWEMRK